MHFIWTDMPEQSVNLDQRYLIRVCRYTVCPLVEIDLEIFFMLILSLLLIQGGQLLVSGERMCTILVN